MDDLAAINLLCGQLLSAVKINSLANTLVNIVKPHMPPASEQMPA